jgi:hypothetical protein
MILKTKEMPWISFTSMPTAIITGLLKELATSLSAHLL